MKQCAVSMPSNTTARTKKNGRESRGDTNLAERDEMTPESQKYNRVSRYLFLFGDPGKKLKKNQPRQTNKQRRLPDSTHKSANQPTTGFPYSLSQARTQNEHALAVWKKSASPESPRISPEVTDIRNPTLVKTSLVSPTPAPQIKTIDTTSVKHEAWTRGLDVLEPSSKTSVLPYEQAQPFIRPRSGRMQTPHALHQNTRTRTSVATTA